MCSNEVHLLELIGHALKSLRSNTKQQRYIGQNKFYYHQSTIGDHKKKKRDELRLGILGTLHSVEQRRFSKNVY